MKASVNNKVGEDNAQSFSFAVSSDNKKRVCEGAFLVVCKLSRDGTLYTASNQYKVVRRMILNPDSNQDLIAVKEYIRSEKSDRCTEFVTNIVKSFSDSTPLEPKNVIVPYGSVKSMFDDYVQLARHGSVVGKEIASYSTFRIAFKNYKQTMREMHDKNVCFLGSKGSFKTCDVCNNIHDLLGLRRYKYEEREIIKDLRLMHLKQQQTERKHLQANRELAATIDAMEQPKCLFIYPDGMTTYTGNTPKTSNQIQHHIQNRVIGVEVVCGQIDKTYLYNSDQLVSGGANFMIEIIRQGINK